MHVNEQHQPPLPHWNPDCFAPSHHEETGSLMSKSLLDQLPAIVAGGKRQAAQILESLEGRNRVSLQTRELVIPSKDTGAADLFRRTRSLDRQEQADTGWFNRLIYGDNLLAMAALLAGDEETPSLRGQVDLIYIDPPFDSKADYRRSHFPERRSTRSRQ
jgi:adenine-specific DNA-methyltransferase